MIPAERDELWEIMDFVTKELHYHCYLKFSTAYNKKNKPRPLLMVVIPKYNNIHIGVPLDEIMVAIDKIGVYQTCTSLGRTIKQALDNFKRDHPGFGDI